MQTLYNSIRQRLRETGIEKPELEARILMKHVFGMSDADIIELSALRNESASPVCYVDDMAKPADIEKIESMLARRLLGEPLSRITGTREFWGLPFLLTPDTLDPRPDTETLIEAALQRFTGNANSKPPGRILDIGTGTGCIPIALLHEWPETVAVATDISAGAIETAKRNAEINGVAERITFIKTSWAEGIEGPFDLILSNPPYIPSGIIPNLATEVKNHDPILGLDGGPDGLTAYKAVLTEIKRLLAPDGTALLEIGYDQAESVPRLVVEYGATPSRLVSDLAGIPRVVECHLGITK